MGVTHNRRYDEEEEQSCLSIVSLPGLSRRSGCAYISTESGDDIGAVCLGLKSDKAVQ